MNKAFSFDAIASLIALIGFDAQGMQTVAFICTKEQIQHTCEVLFQTYPSTETVGQYGLGITLEAQQRYIREDVEQMSKLPQLAPTLGLQELLLEHDAMRQENIVLRRASEASMAHRKALEQVITDYIDLLKNLVNQHTDEWQEARKEIYYRADLLLRLNQE